MKIKKTISHFLHRLGDWLYTSPIMQIPIEEVRVGDVILLAFRGVDIDNPIKEGFTEIQSPDEVSVYYKVQID